MLFDGKVSAKKAKELLVTCFNQNDQVKNGKLTGTIGGLINVIKLLDNEKTDIRLNIEMGCAAISKDGIKYDYYFFRGINP